MAKLISDLSTLVFSGYNPHLTIYIRSPFVLATINGRLRLHCIPITNSASSLPFLYLPIPPKGCSALLCSALRFSFFIHSTFASYPFIGLFCSACA
ncbi:hypothetical protein LSTR_LSTR001511 [Laodelphax striatellus]|uniref:Uncharacterized protein n=1 Tax=Laodelphax striatellus TaxID=195883 RepID=A0A482XCK6_LAOST|nr:hypothetical protein LSTR_LSTR001510 [Laodelphax striatellus]RZF43250.1 hypothetical protein LSTR_LSTR001511 [Laodelphax striatellus]